MSNADPESVEAPAERPSMSRDEFFAKLKACQSNFKWTVCYGADGRLRATHTPTNTWCCPITAVAMHMGIRLSVLDAIEAGDRIGMPKGLVLGVIQAADNGWVSGGTRRELLKAVGL